MAVLAEIVKQLLGPLSARFDEFSIFKVLLPVIKLEHWNAMTFMTTSIPRCMIVRMAFDAKVLWNHKFPLLSAVAAYLFPVSSLIERLPFNLRFKERGSKARLLKAHLDVMASNDQIVIQREHMHYSLQFLLSEQIVVEWTSGPEALFWERKERRICISCLRSKFAQAQVRLGCLWFWFC